VNASLFLFFFLTAAAFAQEVSGLVKDPSGAPVSGANVRLESVAGGAHAALVTGTDGRFKFNDVRQERVLLVVETLDFERFVKPVTPDGKEVTVKL